MKVYPSLTAASDGSLRGVALCLGNFEGVHLGHRALFEEAMRHGPPAVLTFSPHPVKVLRPQVAPRCITSHARKLELFAQSGLVAAIVQPFSVEYAKTSAEEFAAVLFDTIGVGHVVVGYDFTYGAGRLGNVQTLQTAAAQRGRKVSAISPVMAGDVVVSSSKICEYIQTGQMEAAAKLLGRPFDVDGTVVQGAGRGHSLGFPTANIDTAHELQPAIGVYAGRLKHAGNWYESAVNIGKKPTFGGNAVTIEAHLLDFTGDLYGQKLRLQFIKRLRLEKHFSSQGALIQQLKQDIEEVRKILDAAIKNDVLG